jgi:protein-disulfide isomerase
MSKTRRVPATSTPRRRPQAPRKRPPAPTSRRVGGWSPSRSTLLFLAVGGAALVAAVLIGVSVLAGGTDTTAPSGGAVTVDASGLARLEGIPQNGLVLGRPGAKATIVEYGDLQCPACMQFATASLPEVIERWVKPGKAKLEFRGLDFIGDDSTRALRFVLAAARQDKGWSAIELFYANQGAENSGWVTDDVLRGMATALGLDPEQMVAAASSSSFDDAIARSDGQARSDGVSSTPTFVVTSERGRSTTLVGAQPPDAFAAAVNAADGG